MRAGQAMGWAEAALGAFLLALGLFIAVETARMEVGPAFATVGPRFFPYLVAAGLGLVAAALLREAFAGKAGGEEAVRLDWPAFALVAGALIAEMLLLDWIGWIQAAALLFALTARAFLSRRPWLDLALGLGVGAATFAAFDFGLDLSLPMGQLYEMAMGR